MPDLDSEPPEPLKIQSVILAAGQGTRMRSALPKVLHPMLGHPLAWYALEAARQATGAQPVLVIGHQADEVRKALGEAARYVVQSPQLGTGHAVMQTRPLLEAQADWIVVTYADMPLVTEATLNRLLEIHRTNPGPVSMVTVIATDPRGFGRVVRDAEGNVQGIVEEAQATPEQLAITELNASVYCFTASWLWAALEQVPLSPKGEYYLTDVVEIAVKAGMPVAAFQIEDGRELIGINNRIHLAEAAAVLQERINQQWMLAGVTLIDPGTYIEPEVRIGADTVIWPGSLLMGKTVIGERCTIGPHAILKDVQVGPGCTVIASTLEGASLPPGEKIGPYEVR